MQNQEEIIGENLLEEDKTPGSGITESQEEQQPEKRHLFLGAKKFLIPLTLALLFLLILLVPSFFVARAASRLQSSAWEINEALKEQNLGRLKEGISRLKEDLYVFDRSLTPLVWLRPFPWISAYWQDAKNGARGGLAAIEATELLIPTIEPYADILGFGKGEAQPTDGAKTAEERIDFIVASLPSVTPKLGQVGEKLNKASDSLNLIDPGRYPESFRGNPVRKKIEDLQILINSARTLIVDGKPLLEVTPYLMGMGEERTYLVIFQNDKELRPTGGFMTAYSLMKVKDGKIQPVSSDDIYNLDKRYRANIEAPKPFLEHIKQPYSQNPNWRLRDMNWSPDFKTTMDLFLEEAKKARLPKVDGVISVDTNVLVSILQVTGQIGVPGQGNFSADLDSRCECPQVIYELEIYADVEKPIVWDPNTGKIVFGEIVDNRKAILGPLVNSVIANGLAQPRDKVPQLAQAVLSNLQEKHVLFYMFDENVQKALESFNIAGRIRNTQGDYLAIVDANLGGRKSNLYVTHEVIDNIKIEESKVIHEMAITYKNPKPHDGWLNSVLPNYMRIYVPKGARLISSSGADIEVSEDLDKTVFGGFFELRPEGIVKITLNYEVPKVSGEKYALLIQKQPGKPTFRYTINVGRRIQEIELETDREFRFE